MVKTKKVTLTDVAERAGVSATTASYILNGRSAEMRISSDAEARVRRAVADLGYRPNRNARSLRTATTKTIGVITDFVASGMFASRMIAGANAAARAHDHLLVIGETEGDPAVEQLLNEEMVDRQVDGIIYVTRTTLRTTLSARMTEGSVVMLNCYDPDRAVSAVLPDERAGGRAAVGALLDAGFRDGIHVVGEDSTPNAVAGTLRLSGIKARLADDGLEVAGIVACDWAVGPAYDAVDRWLRSGGRPRALVCLNDRIAMGAYQALAAHGLDVPGDVSVVSFDGSELATWLRPHVTSVALPFLEMGELAVELLLDPGRAARTTHLVSMPLVPGASIGPSATHSLV